MGKTLDTLLGRNFKTSKFKTLAKLAVSRVSILKNQRQVRCSHATSDVVELLKLGHQDRALLRVEHVIRERNMMDAFAMVESYCHLLTERVFLLQKNKECPDELKEAISTLIFVSSRCGEFPELQGIRGIFASRFGNEFATRAVELRNNCGVSPKMIQKLSVRQPSLESRMRALKEIASENNITLHLEEDVPPGAVVVAEDKKEGSLKHKEQEESNKLAISDDTAPQFETQVLPEGFLLDEKLSESLRPRKQYRDVATAAQEAFESAAYAAAAARAAVVLSRSESRDNDRSGDSGSSHGRKSDGSSPSHRLPNDRDEVTKDKKHSHTGFVLEKIHPGDNSGSESETEELADTLSIIHLKDMEVGKKKPGMDRTLSASSSDSLSENQPVGNQMIIYGELGNISSPEHLGFDSYRKSSPATNDEDNKARLFGEVRQEDVRKLPYRSRAESADAYAYPMEGKSKLKSIGSLNFAEQDRKVLSVRTRRD